jgi:single-stranded-DNA-specific exonuclease
LLADADFPAGVVGLVAGKLVEEFYRPTLLIERGEQESRGSARSIGAFHITAALRTCSDLLTRFGGHRVAAGFSIPNENLTVLEERLETLAEEQLDTTDLTPTLYVDAKVTLADLNWDLLRTLEKMAPFGIENPRAVFLCPGVKVLRARRFGKEGKHLRLTVNEGHLTQDAVAWRMGKREAECREGTFIDLVCTLNSNAWGGRERLELVVRDLRPAGVTTKTG